MKDKEPLEKREDQAEKEASGPERKPASGNKKAPLVLAFMIVLSVGAAIALTALVLPHSSSSPSQKVDASPGEEPELKEAYYESEEIFSNLHGEHWRRLIKIQVGIYFKAPDPKEMVAGFEAGKPLFKDAMIGILSSKTMDEIDTREGKNKLKEEIAEALNDLFLREKKGKVEKIVFITYLTQQG